jgi:hypothetical protein
VDNNCGVASNVRNMGDITSVAAYGGHNKIIHDIIPLNC